MEFLKKWIVRIALFAIAIVALLAAADNSTEVPLTFLGYQTGEWPVSWWMLSAFVIGVLFGMALNTFANLKLRWSARSASKQATRAKDELDKARATPLSTDAS